MAVSPARKIAFEVLRQVALEDAYASDVLFARLCSPNIKQADAALATELTLGVLRWQGVLDFLLQRHLDRPVTRSIGRLDLEVLLALRLGLYQLRFLDRVPVHAAVSESVELAKLARKRSAAPLVNAVLRRAAAEARISGEKLEALIAAGIVPAESGTDAHQLSILHSHPVWMVERWLAHFGRERAIALFEANNRPGHLSCALHEEDDAGMATQSLQSDGFEVAPGRWLRSALAISGGNPAGARAFREGRLGFQDEASQMIAHLVDSRAGDRILDLCAAPGGKTLILARATAPQGRVFSCDLHQHRLRTTRRQLERTSTQNVDLLALDAAQPLPFTRQFDRILLDAPCSGTGTLARNPEIRWRLRPEDLNSAHRQQAAMLRNALSALAPAGRLVYATCSLEAEENEQVIQEVLDSETAFRIVSGTAALAPRLRDASLSAWLFDQRGFFRTFPPQTDTDGFFAAVLERKY